MLVALCSSIKSWAILAELTQKHTEVGVLYRFTYPELRSPMKAIFLLLLLPFVLAGCAQIPAPQNIPWTSHQQQINELNEWDFTGKLALITPKERHSLNIYWLQSGDDFHISLTTFLGSTVLDVKKTQFGTQIIDNNGDLFFGMDTEVLINKLSGLIIPIDLLQQWIKGNPNDAIYQLNENNQVLSLSGIDKNRANWIIDYSDYKVTQGIYLPHKLQLKRDHLRLKFAISKWQINHANMDSH